MNFEVLLAGERKRRGLSVYRLSDISGVVKSTIFSYERGVMPTLDKADRLLKALGVSLVIGCCGR